MNTETKNSKKLKKRTYATVIAILLVFGSFAIMGSIFGSWLDSKYDMEPTGTIVGLAISYVLSWLVAGNIAFRFFKK